MKPYLFPRSLLIVFLLFSVFVAVSAMAQSTQTKIEIDEGTVAENGTVDLPISVSPSGGATVGVVTTNITYDQTAIEVTGCSLASTMKGVCDTATVGVVKLSAVIPQGITTKTTIANISIKATGVEGNIAKFTPTTVLLADKTGIAVSDFADVDGKITINKRTNFSIYIPIITD